MQDDRHQNRWAARDQISMRKHHPNARHPSLFTTTVPAGQSQTAPRKREAPTAPTHPNA
ncbi:hypothetical protein RAS12_18985 [Achromobacter seleniivolatilans]|uniref:Transposase n=1 Tax=Achromobacter seleniivolatilans TaxID=3047478 RepID=A0ABY9LWA8_9BURK|nr:hypothetical protein [Achromobacter sp. R39]WMD18705.1 hypothetical protein RAS12_18985 [Achromobacter sp. R39]